MRGPSRNVHLETNDAYLLEVRAWYALAVFVILLRFAVRLGTVGIRGFRGDDYLALPVRLRRATCEPNLTTTSISRFIPSMSMSSRSHTTYTGANIDITAKIVPKLSDHDVEVLELGSKLEFLSWYTYPGCIWVLKFTVLFFYRRLTLGILRRKTLIALFWMCGFSYMALCLTVSLSCRPHSNNWRIRPLPGPECTFRPQNFWVLVWLNVITDAALLSIPVPILWHLRVSLRRKIGVGILLSSGIFVISTAIVRAVSTLNEAPSVININRWGFRETAVGLITVTIPVLSPLFTKAFWRRGPYIRDYYDRLQPRERPNQVRFGNWGTMVLRYIDEEEGQVFEDPNSAKHLDQEGYRTRYPRDFVVIQ